ncbi:PREDICTED: uncharacterized protein LOC109189790 [Ipomoea nil]|uniref:uncharacterized protein LOC109189790 n=1 Tax=Ipomoea nil TaxID=35883 RepID=UPI0009014548|nr:PREDICTED: uncharacterized protein LOC109189790 [Ipomoea nil]XP_019195964.1 PREDICTED: uncharacterized protein LOC109189790 [Ipomoea nil]XP_019195965.1 PREDICTED: uncharacterized protein LOC109189790 [Ipomoea nil]
MFTRGDLDLNLVLRYDPLPKEVLKPAMLKQEHIFKKQVSTRLSVNSLQERRVFFEQRVLVPQFCSNQHFNHVNRDNLVKENSPLCPQKPVKIKHSFHARVTPSEEVDLSLSIGWNKQRNDIIDLEDSDETVLHGEVNNVSTFGYAARVGYSGGNYDSGSTHSIITHGPDKNQFEGTDRSQYSSVDCSRGLLEQSSLSKGVTQCCNVVISEDTPSNRKRFSSDERALLDLNRHPNELSFHPTDPGSVSSSTGAFLRDSRGMVGGSHDNDASHNAPNRRDQADDDDCNNVVAALDSSGSHDGHTSKVEPEGMTITLEIQNGSKRAEDTRFSDECMTRDTVLEDMEVDRSPILCKSNYAADDNMLSRTVTEESGNRLAKSNTPVDNAGLSQAAKSPRHEDNAESCGNNDSNFQGGDDQKGKAAAEVDNDVQKGAVSLLFFKLESTRDRSKTRQQENDSNEQQPLYSCDTFESMVLKLPECNVDDDDSCVSSKPFEVKNVTSNKDCGIALRRGRRMKDFRRDILPNLASLSRHEISEDIKIMETVLRSREYKKIMSRMKGGEQKCFTPVRSKRSRLNYAGQKHHS